MIEARCYEQDRCANIEMSRLYHGWPTRTPLNAFDALLRYVSVCIRDDVIHCILKWNPKMAIFVVHGAGCSVRVGNWQEDIVLQEVKF